MATGPGDELEAAGRGHLRASHADREQMIEVLKAAFIRGRLAKEDFDVRVGQVLASRTYTDLAVATALPAGAAASQPPQTRSRARARKPVNNNGKVAAWGACGSIPLALVAALLLTGHGTFFVLAVVAFSMEAPVATVIMADAWAQKRSHRRQLSPGPAPDPRGPAPAAGSGSRRDDAARSPSPSSCAPDCGSYPRRGPAGLAAAVRRPWRHGAFRRPRPSR